MRIRFRFIGLICSIFLGDLQAQSDTLAWWSLNEKDANFIQEKMTGANFSLISPYCPIESKPGLSNSAIQLNGYSSWIEGDLYKPLPNDKFTLSLWVAVKSYPVNTTAFFSNYDDTSKKGFYLGLDRFGRPVLQVNIAGSPVNLLSVVPLAQNTWSHLAMVIENGSIYFYINGERVSTYNQAVGKVQLPEKHHIKIGKFPKSTLVGIFETNVFNGLIDEVIIRASPLDATAIKSWYQSYLPIKAPDLSVLNSRFQKDHWRPIFHPIPEAAWTNEPHGFIHHKGKYHLFFQKNANGPYWSQINWGHLSSPDLLTWQEEQTALYPELGYDQSGIWSGNSVIDDEGNLALIYTGVDGATAQVCLAKEIATTPQWVKYRYNPVVESPPSPYTSQDFRDPFVWKQNNQWYMIIGSGGVNNTGGAALLYKGSSLTEWTYLGVLHKANPTLDGAGIFWEMPVFLRFGEKYVLMVNPVSTSNKPAQALYWTGTFNNDKFVPDYMVPKKLELLNALLSPTVTQDEAGRWTAIGIIPDDLAPEGQREKAWSHLYSMARVWTLSLDGKTLLQAPHPAYQKLRSKPQRLENLSLNNEQKRLSPIIQGRNLELRATIDPQTATSVGFVIAKTNTESEQTKISYDRSTNSIILDRSKSSLSPYATKDVKSAFVNLPANQKIDWHIFIDGSVVEVFINDQIAFATRIFPETPESISVDVFARGGRANFVTIEAWEMMVGNEITVSNRELSPVRAKKFFQLVYPNPVDQVLNLELNLPGKLSHPQLQLYNALGQLLKVAPLPTSVEGQRSSKIDTSKLPKGLYFLQLSVPGKILDTTTFIKN